MVGIWRPEAVAKMERIIKRMEGVVLPEYILNDKAHGHDHLSYVCDRCIKFAKQAGASMELAFIAGYYHDMKHHSDPANHEILSAEAFFNDPFMKNELSKESMLAVRQAIEDHRSFLSGSPRNIYGKILVSADKDTDVKTALQGCGVFAKQNFDGQDIDYKVDQAIDFIRGKYGENGRASIYFKDDAYAAMKHRFMVLLGDRRLFKHAYIEACGE